MLQCVECGSKINAEDITGGRIECDACGIELEIVGNTLIGLQLGPSEE
jgi:transcription initiation factor TFIIIB Brf1 subunit/transcription initiation factor TFIIB